MRIVQLLITGLVVAAGLVGALVLMVFGLLTFLIRRLFGRPAATPSFQWHARVNPHPGSRPPPARRPDPNVIDIEATEVKETPALRDRPDPGN